MLRARLLAFGLVCTAALGASPALAQTISVSGQPYPNRILPDNTNLGYSTRPQNLDPLGISYDDCEQDQTLQFELALTGFTGSDNVEVWASLNSDCTATTDRGIGATATVCWAFPANQINDLVSNGNSTYNFNVRVRDLVAWQVTPPPLTEATDPPSQGEAACHAQPTPAAVSININFLAIDGDGNSDGSPYQYTMTTDMVGPPAPVGQSESAGDTLMNIYWTANVDSDTAGYDVFIDPIPGQEGDEAGALEASSAVLVCPEASVGLSDASLFGPDGELIEASLPPPPVPDAACYYLAAGSSTQGNPGAHCNDPILQGAIVEDGGAEAGVFIPPVLDEAGDILSEGGVEGNGGISTIPTQYLIGAGSGITISDKSVGQYTVTGLQDGTWYNMVVAAVDGTGNIGPASVEVCDYPAPVRDFWDTYREDGGSAGGFCALEAVGTGAPSLAGIGAVFLGATLLRRRRRRNNERA